METEVHSTLTDGIAAAGAGDTEEAQRLLRHATELEPQNAEAWLWRARVTDNTADKKSFLEESLRLNPNNVDALAALERIAKKEGAVTARMGTEEDTYYCTVHPDRATLLRCNRCGRPMCTDCAVQHPVGLRCRECVSQTKSPAYQVDNATFVRALGAATVVGTIVAFGVLLFGGMVGGFLIFLWFAVGGAIGRGIAEAVSRLVPRKRGRMIQIATGIGIVAGLLIAAAILGQGGPATVAFLFRLPVLLYLGTAVTAAVASLR